jgi:hypothetical protein
MIIDQKLVQEEDVLDTKNRKRRSRRTLIGLKEKGFLAVLIKTS